MGQLKEGSSSALSWLADSLTGKIFSDTALSRQSAHNTAAPYILGPKGRHFLALVFFFFFWPAQGARLPGQGEPLSRRHGAWRGRRSRLQEPYGEGFLLEPPARRSARALPPLAGGCVEAISIASRASPPPPSAAWSVPLIALLSLLSRNWTVPRGTDVRAPPTPASKQPAPLTLLGRVG